MSAEQVERVDVVVVGGGVMGSAAAWELARRGRDVVLLERFGPGHANGASHGASRIYRTTYGQPEYLDLAQEALGLWRELERESGLDVLTLTGGVSHGLPRRDDIAAAFDARGVPYEWLHPEEAAERWPGLRFEGSVLHEPSTAGRVHADRAVEAFQAVARARGADIRHDVRVRSILPVAGGVRVSTDDGELLAQRVVLAAGGWVDQLLPGALGGGLGADSRAGERADGAAVLPVVVTQEQPAHFQLRAGAPAEDSWPSFTHSPSPDLLGPGRTWPAEAYGMATPGEGIKVGLHGVGVVTDPDRRSFLAEPERLATLQSYVAQWVPGVDPDDLVPVSCTYTTTPDEDFVLDRVGRVVVAAGFSGHGFKFGPAIGRVLADLATEPVDTPAGSSAARFALARFTS
ncbi:FAD-dependent oxidoreductase [Sanguibacter sp. 25GB23B1]|uniref:FAD-dependent oxidoreductase n=1 Tax=unclassified Sanguibacter TaxID=2645534 RepID=UPI0032AF095B